MSGNGLITTRELDRRFINSLPGDMPADVASAKLRRFQQDRETSFKKWDALVGTDEFEAFLHSRGLAFCEWEKWHTRPVSMESAALGSMLMLDDEAVTKGMQRLHAAHFARIAHRHIFGAICLVERRRQLGLHPSLKSLDIVVIADQLRCIEDTNGPRFLGDTRTPTLLDAIGGADYLMMLIEDCPSSANIDFYIARLIEESKARHLFYLGHELVALAGKPDVSPRRLAAFLRACNRRIERDGWCDFRLLEGQLSK